MKVNISGNGFIPIVNSLAPVRGVEISERDAARLLSYRKFRIYSAQSGLLITMDNISEIFKSVKVEKPKKVEAPVIEKKPEPVKIEIVQEPFTEEEIKPVIEEPKPTFLSVTEIKTEEAEPIAEIVETIVEEPIEDKAEFLDSVIEETTEEVVETEVAETTEEVSETEEEKKEDKPYQKYKNKKNKRH